MEKRTVNPGMRFGKLTVIGQNGKNHAGRTLWRCECDCGESRNVIGKDLLSGNTKSCGCYQREVAREANTTHGLRGHKLYSVHKAMLRRCNDPRDPAYDRYGGRGITVCQEWSGPEGFSPFYEWSMGNGYKEGLTLDRINNDDGYKPENCRWEDYGVQGRNRRTQKNNPTGVRGVQFRKRQGDYRVVISFEGKRFSCGCYKTLEEAVQARNEAEKTFWGKGGENNGS